MPQLGGVLSYLSRAQVGSCDQTDSKHIIVRALARNWARHSHPESGATQLKLSSICGSVLMVTGYREFISSRG